MKEGDTGREDQVTAAYNVFRKLLPEMLRDHEGKWVIIKYGDEKIYRGYWHCMKDANKVASEELGDDRPFILQEVTEKSIAVLQES